MTDGVSTLSKLKNLNIEDKRKKTDDLNHASFKDRYTAHNVDGLIMGIIYFTIVFFLIFYHLHLLPQNPVLLFLTFIALFESILLSYSTLLEYMGRTLGKDFVGLKVVNESGDSITLKQSLIRNLEYLVWIVPLLGQFTMLWSYDSLKLKNQRKGDEWAETYVVEIKDRPSEKTNQFHTEPHAEPLSDRNMK